MSYLQDAPIDLPKRDLWLLETCTVARPGIGIARGRDGQAYRLCLLELDGHPEALRRSVRIAYEPIPSAGGGGVLQVPATLGRPSENALAALREALRIGSLIPGQNFFRHMDGDYTAMEELADKTLLEPGSYVVLSQELQTAALLHNRGALFLAGGLGLHGSIDLQAYGAVGVQGPMLGRIDVDSYAYVYVDGPLQGELNIDSYATVVLQRGLAGTLRLRSYADILIRGHITGSLDVKGSCWSTVYLDDFYSESELIAMSQNGSSMHQITLHVRSSDLPSGEYDDVGTWRHVIIDDPVWTQFAK